METNTVDAILRAALVFLPVLYALVTAGYGFLFFANDPTARRVAPPLFYSTLGLHLGYLALLGLRWGQFPVASVSQALSAVAFAVAAIYAFVEWHGREPSTGFMTLSVATVLEIMAALLRTPEPPNREIFHNPLFATHTGLGLLGYAAFMVAAAYGFLFLRLYHEIKRSRFSVFFGKLPPLEVLERMMTGAMLAGFLALTGAVLSGAFWAHQEFAKNWWMDPKIQATFGIWAFYGLMLLFHRLHRLQTRHLALASLAGVAAILFSMIGINLFFSKVHEFF